MKIPAYLCIKFYSRTRRILSTLLLILLLIFMLSSYYLRFQTPNYKYTQPVNVKTSLACTNDSFAEIVRSEKSWMSFVDSLNIEKVNYHTLSKGFKPSVGMFPFSLISIPLIHANVDFIDFRIRFSVVKSGMNSGVGGLNLLYKQTNDEVAVGEVGNPTASRHYPIYFNMTKYLDGIAVGLPENEIPVNNDALLAVQLPDNTCNPSHSRETFDLVVLVKSCVYCTEQRSYARKTYMKSDHWNNFRVKFVFVVGLPTPTPTNIHYFNGVTVVLNGRSERLSKNLQSSGWSALRELKKESDSHGDVLIGGFYDNYFNLTKKMMLTFRWASMTFHKRTPLFLFLDDDYVLHPENTIKLVRSLNRSEVKWFAGGQVHPTSVVTRPTVGSLSSRWSVSRDEYPWDYYPPYFFGVCYILGAELVEHASIVMSFTQDLRMDDAYLGIVLARLNKSLTNLKQFSVSTRNVDHMSSLVNIQRSMANRLFTSD
uniref:Hexosyltransferase n=1 Tax=Trichobilharzia regenti TaxID=157069 RepID=A0AA85KFF0_TRIRE|nr:unnamed protein product [Trichobilharzia regenti]